MTDYIDRYAVFNAIDDAINNNALSYEGCVNDILKYIAKLPAADVRPVRRGKWEIKKASIHPYGNDVCCSACGFTMGSSFGYNFCPNCGANMRPTSMSGANGEEI